MLRRVFYVSEIVAPTTSLDVRAIVSASLIWNRRHDLTGLLVASVNHFAQVLECRDEAMKLVLERIRRDPHHRSIHVQFDEVASLRRFEKWSMAYVQRDDLSCELERLHAAECTPSEKRAVMEELEQSGLDCLPEL